MSPYKLLSTIFISFVVLTTVNLSAEDLPYTYYPQEDAIAKYLNQMPWEYYRPYYVPNLGWFWLDDAKDCVKDTLKQGLRWEEHILKQLSIYLKPGDVAVDIGGHTGTISLAMSNIVGPTGTVHTFEGERQMFRELVENARFNERPNIKPYLCWLSNEDKDIQVTWQIWGPDYSPVYTSEGMPYTLHVHRLDSFALPSVNLIKIDVECTEDDILEGARETIMRCRPVILLEIMGGYGWRVTPDIRARIDHTISILNGMGYTVRQIMTDDYLALPKH